METDTKLGGDFLREGLAQLDIFRAEDLPEAPELVAAAKEFKHSGAITRKSHELVEAMLRLHALGVSDAAISRRLHVSRNTVAAILRPEGQAEQASIAAKLEQLKGRQFEVLAEVFALAAENLRELLIAGKVEEKTLGIVLGISMEKMLLLTGQATQIVDVKRGPDPGEVEAYLDRLKRVAGVVVEAMPADGQSESVAPIPKETAACPESEARLEAQAVPRPAPQIGAQTPAKGPPTTPGGGSATTGGAASMDSLAYPT